MRALQVNDVFSVARILGKITKGARVQLASALSSKKSDPTELGLILFQSLPEAEDEVKAWLADLAGKTKEEFSTMPATALLDVIDELTKQEDIKDFFAKASQLVGGKKT